MYRSNRNEWEDFKISKAHFLQLLFMSSVSSNSTISTMCAVFLVKSSPAWYFMFMSSDSSDNWILSHILKSVSAQQEGNNTDYVQAGHCNTKIYITCILGFLLLPIFLLLDFNLHIKHTVSLYEARRVFFAVKMSGSITLLLMDKM